VNLRAFAALALLGQAACTSSVRLPMTGAELSREREPAALVAFLGQPGAGAGACEPGRVSADLLRARGLPGALVDALSAGRLPPEVFADCALALLPALAPERASALVGECLRAEVRLVGDPALETEDLLGRRRAALHRVLLERGPGLAPPRGAGDDASRALAGLLRSTALGPGGRLAAEELSALLEAERGRWRGGPVDARALDAAAREGGDGPHPPSLPLLARRLPDPTLRSDAERRLVRARIAASRFEEVRAAAAEVEARVLREGVNAVPLARHPPERAELPLPVGTRVLVRQDVTAQRATLLGLAAGAQKPTVAPELGLQGALWVKLAGISGAVTLCAPGRALDPTPCLAASEVSSSSPIATAGRALRLREGLSAAEVVDLVRAGGTLEVPLSVGGHPLASVAYPLVLERPAELVLEGQHRGARGPDLAVEVERPSPALLVYTVRAGDRTFGAVMAWPDAGAFRVVTRGGRGWDGADGQAGRDGRDGRGGASASCLGGRADDGEAGEDGGNGGDGGNGSPGGDGGDADVRVVTAPDALRAETLALVRATVVSEGGPGGAGGGGGRGGRGGSGGSGGLGTVCFRPDGSTESMGSGSSGMSGRDGSGGSSGWPGSPGRPGVVRITQ